MEAHGERLVYGKWSAIFMGALLSLTVLVGLAFLANGLELGILDSKNGKALGTMAQVVTAGGMAIGVFLALFGGGYAASRLSAIHIRFAAAMQGLAVWALVAAIAVVLGGTGVANYLAGVFWPVRDLHKSSELVAKNKKNPTASQKSSQADLVIFGALLVGALGGGIGGLTGGRRVAKTLAVPYSSSHK